MFPINEQDEDEKEPHTESKTIGVSKESQVKKKRVSALGNSAILDAMTNKSKPGKSVLE